MDARARARGAPLKSGASVRKETMRDSGGAQFVKSLLRSRKDLCRLDLELPSRDGTIVAEVHFVCLPGQSEGDVAVDQALASLPAGLREMLGNFHVHGLRNDEVQMLKDSRSLTEHKDAGPQCRLKAVCVLRHNPGASGQPAAGATSLAGLLGRYVAGIRYAVELQSLRRDEARRSEEDDTNRSVSSIEDDFVTALENLEEVEMGDGPRTWTNMHLEYYPSLVRADILKHELHSVQIPQPRHRRELAVIPRFEFHLTRPMSRSCPVMSEN